MAETQSKPKAKKRKRSVPKVEEFRRQEFIDMGFKPDDAVALSNAKDTKTGLLVDKYKIKRAITLGCPHETAVKIWT